MDALLHYFIVSGLVNFWGFVDVIYSICFDVTGFLNNHNTPAKDWPKGRKRRPKEG